MLIFFCNAVVPRIDKKQHPCIFFACMPPIIILMGSFIILMQNMACFDDYDVNTKCMLLWYMYSASTYCNAETRNANTS